MTWASERNEIRDFLIKSLPTRLVKDQKELRIVSEGDLQSCVYYHTRRFLKKKRFTGGWYILNKLSMGEKTARKVFPDVVVTSMAHKGKKNYATFLIELKESTNFKEELARREIKKLERMLDDYADPYNAFFLYACLDNKRNRKVKDTNKILEEMISKKYKELIIPKTINIKGMKTYSADLDYFDEKIKILRKYRG